MPAPAPFPRVKRQLLISDFDESMADADSDRWTFEVLSPRLRRQFDDLSHAPIAERMQFTDLCAHLLEKLHTEEGKGEQDVRNAQRMLYMHPAMIRGFRALRDAKDTGAGETQTTCFLLSNSNEMYLGTILEHHGLQTSSYRLFDEIVTNPAHFEPSGLLRLSRRILASAKDQHDCKVGCSANMCKGDELEAFLRRRGGREAAGFERLIYLGDGGNDYCPVMRMKEQDVALVRRGRGLEKRIKAEGMPKCQVRWWNDAWEVEELFAALRGQSLY